ncbi:MAG: preprotein translocase subunit SecG [Ruminococcaceae bacterium]|nr:preprotein translocase subunit SecG [Oscillospiraceae bacterium]
MSGLQIALSVILIIISIALIVLVLLQKDRESSASAVMGGGSDFFDKTKGRKKDYILSKATAILGSLLAIIAAVTILINYFA